MREEGSRHAMVERLPLPLYTLGGRLPARNRQENLVSPSSTLNQPGIVGAISGDSPPVLPVTVIRELLLTNTKNFTSTLNIKFNYSVFF